MKTKNALLICLTIISFSRCKESPTDFALIWSIDIKNKILEDVNLSIDSISVDSISEDYKEVHCYHKKIQTKEFGIKNNDTILSIFYSPDQHFELVRELCPRISRNFEGIRYKGKSLGLAEFRFCNGKLKEQGCRFEGDVGLWKEWDSNGTVINEIDHGKTDRLEKLKLIHYSR